MNLQIPVPYKKCVYKCPFCCARGHKHNYNFTDLHSINSNKWKAKLVNALNDADTAIITGECDPTQDISYVKDVVSLLKKSWTKIPIEFTTHNMKAVQTLKYYNVKDLDVITFSITNMREYLNAWNIKKDRDISKVYRMVICLTNEFEFFDKDNFSPMGFDQVTFKLLQHGEDEVTNNWIDNNKFNDSKLDNILGIVDKFNSSGKCSVRLDTTCQTGNGRYKIFRCDGNIYSEWSDETPCNTEEYYIE